jgi:hypothetical protein
VVVDRDADQEGRGQQHEGDVAIPTDVTADFIVVQSEGFVRF